MRLTLPKGVQEFRPTARPLRILRSRRFQTTLVALVLLIGGAIGAWYADAVHDPPENAPAEITVYGDNPLDVSNGGWAALVAVHVRACQNPVHVTMTFAGTLGLWRNIVKSGNEVQKIVVSALPHGVRMRSITVADAAAKIAILYDSRAVA